MRLLVKVVIALFLAVLGFLIGLVLGPFAFALAGVKAVFAPREPVNFEEKKEQRPLWFAKGGKA